MSCVLRKDPEWPDSLSFADISVALTLLSEDDCQVPVPAALLLAVSPLVNSMMGDLLPPAYSPHVISIPEVNGDVLHLVAEILSNGKAILKGNTREKVEDVFKIMRIEAFLSYCQFENISLDYVVDREVKNEYFTEVTEGCFKSEMLVKIDKSEKNEYFEAYNNLKMESEEIESYLSESEKSAFQFPLPSNKNKPADEKQDIECDKNVPIQNVRQHTGDKPFKCDECTYSASNLKNLKKHMLIHTGERPFSCDQCDYKGRRLDHLSIHKKNNHGPGKLKPFKCDKCAYSGASSVLVKQHMRIHSGEKPYACDQCDYKSSSRQHLVSHEAYKHGQKNENPRTSSLYIKNSNGDLKSYQCQVCEYLADNKKAMVLHVLRHTGKRLSKYDKCEFNTGKSPFLKHKLNHVKGKELQCVQCEYKTVNQDSLYKHTRQHTKLKCDQCEFSTDHLMYLSSHKRREHYANLQPTLAAGEPVNCINCGKKCKSKKSLEKHNKRRHLTLADFT